MNVTVSIINDLGLYPSSGRVEAKSPFAYLLLPFFVAAVVLMGSRGLAQNVHSRALKVDLMGSNSPVGYVIFREPMTGGLNLDIHAYSLQPGLHAVHIHQFPACDGPDFKSAGPHLNPRERAHGWKNLGGHHAGDLPQNLIIDKNGEGELNLTLQELGISSTDRISILGHSVVIHDQPDDMISQPSGKSGNRIACGIITIPAR